VQNRAPFIEKHIVMILLIFSILGLFLPNLFIWAKSLTHSMLTLIAFFVGLNLKINNFQDVWKNKKIIIPVLTFKYLFAPFVTFFICYCSNISILYTIGLVTLTCCPAANTGNILCYLSKGNTALIIITTVTGALLTPLVTPMIIYILLHKIVHINFSDIMFTITTSITIPITAGVFISHYFHKTIFPIKPFIPSIGILSVSMIIAAVLAQHNSEIFLNGLKISILSSALITFFIISGFIYSKLLRCELKNSIAMSFEVGTFDGVLGILLTTQIAGTSATLPVVLFAVLNIFIGSMASKIFSHQKSMLVTA